MLLLTRSIFFFKAAAAVQPTNDSYAANYLRRLPRLQQFNISFSSLFNYFFDSKEPFAFLKRFAFILPSLVFFF